MIILIVSGGEIVVGKVFRAHKAKSNLSEFWENLSNNLENIAILKLDF